MKTLVVAEKPSVAKDIANALGKFDNQKDFLENEKYVITWSLGHICELYEPEDYNKKLSFWTLRDLPIIPEEFEFKVSKENKERFNAIKKLMLRKDVDTIVNACDAGREGELIFREILLLVNPKGKSLKRLWLSAMTKEEIVKEFKNLRDESEFDDLGKASFAREEADWLVGINATRSFTRRWGELLSLGRVQTPTLNIIVSREKQIKSFKPTTYYELEANFKKDDFSYKGVYTENGETRQFDKLNLEKIKKEIEGLNGVIEKLAEKDDLTSPPLLYDLTELQRDANRLFGYSAKRTLDIAQTLYEKRKLITYPRTDSRYLPSTLKERVVEIIKSIKFEPYSLFAYEILKNGIKFTERIINDKGVTDHYAIIPTGDFREFDKLTEQEFKIFDLVMKRFIAVFFGRSKTKKFEVLTSVKEYKFISSLSFLVDPGWMKVYGKDATMPIALKEKMDVMLEKAEVLEKETQPPQRFTDATLLSQMEHANKLITEEDLKETLKGKGIGTPATRAQIIERLIEVGYVEREKNNLLPTEKGIRLIDLVSYVGVEVLLSPSLTAEWEYKLLEIEKGKYDATTFIDGIKKLTNEIIDKVKTYSGDFHVKIGSKDPVGICPKCGGNVYETVRGFTCENVEKGTCDFIIWKKLKNKKITREMAEKLLKGEKVRIKRILSNNKTYFDADIALDKEHKVSFVFEPPVEEKTINEESLGKCPVCGSDVVEKESVYACVNYPKSCNFRIKKLMGGRELSREDVKTLLKDKKTPVYNDFISSKGKKFSASLNIEKGSVKFEFENNGKNRSYRRKSK